MRRRHWIAITALALTGCTLGPSASAPAGAVPLWEPVDAAFAGCQGACGAHASGPEAGVVAQPGAAVGTRTYCPVSGAVFEIAAEHPHAEIGDQRVWFCCAGCATYFEANRASVLRARGIAQPS